MLREKKYEYIINNIFRTGGPALVSVCRARALHRVALSVRRCISSSSARREYCTFTWQMFRESCTMTAARRLCSLHAASLCKRERRFYFLYFYFHSCARASAVRYRHSLGLSSSHHVARRCPSVSLAVSTQNVRRVAASQPRCGVARSNRRYGRLVARPYGKLWSRSYTRCNIVVGGPGVGRAQSVGPELIPTRPTATAALACCVDIGGQCRRRRRRRCRPDVALSLTCSRQFKFIVPAVSSRRAFKSPFVVVVVPPSVWLFFFFCPNSKLFVLFIVLFFRILLDPESDFQ